MVVRAPASAGLSCSSMAVRTCRRRRRSAGSSPGVAAAVLGRTSRESGSVAETLAGDSAAARSRAAASRASALRPLAQAVIRMFCGGRDRVLPAQGFPAATAAWYFSITAAWAASAWASRLPAASAASRAGRSARPGCAAMPAPARRACPAPRAAGPAGRPSRPAAGAPRLRRDRRRHGHHHRRRHPTAAAGPRRPPAPPASHASRLGLDRGLQRGDLRRQLLPVQVREPGRVPRDRGPVHRRAVPPTAPAAASSPSTCTNSRITSARCRRTNCATARWLGTAPPQITRQPRSSTHAAA